MSSADVRSGGVALPDRLPPAERRAVDSRVRRVHLPRAVYVEYLLSELDVFRLVLEMRRHVEHSKRGAGYRSVLHLDPLGAAALGREIKPARDDVVSHSDRRFSVFLVLFLVLPLELERHVDDRNHKAGDGSVLLVALHDGSVRGHPVVDELIERL